MELFVREEPGPAYVARLDETERAVLLDVVDQVVELLDTGDLPQAGYDVLDTLVAQVAPPAPEDLALRRLLPDASADPELAAEMRRLTETDLRVGKTANLLRLRAALADAQPEVVVVPSEGSAVAAAMTDVRLVLSERLGVRTDADAEELYTLAAGPEPTGRGRRAEAEAMRHLLASVYVVLSLLQESLVDVMLGELPEAAEEGRAG